MLPLGYTASVKVNVVGSKSASLQQKFLGKERWFWEMKRKWCQPRPSGQSKLAKVIIWSPPNTTELTGKCPLVQSVKSKSNGCPQKPTFWHTNVSPWVSFFQKCLQWMQQTSVHRRATNFYRFSIGDGKAKQFPHETSVGLRRSWNTIKSCSGAALSRLHNMSRTSISVPPYRLLGRESCGSMGQLWIIRSFNCRNVPINDWRKSRQLKFYDRNVNYIASTVIRMYRR